MSAGLVIQHATRKRHIATCGLPRCTTFSPHYLTNGTIFDLKKNIEHKMCVLMFFKMFVRNIYNSKKDWPRCDHSVCRSACEVAVLSSRCNQTGMFSRNFRKVLKYHKNASSWSRAVSCGRQTDRQTRRSQ